jgi:hypothetical protein
MFAVYEGQKMVGRLWVFCCMKLGAAQKNVQEMKKRCEPVTPYVLTISNDWAGLGCESLVLKEWIEVLD